MPNTLIKRKVLMQRLRENGIKRVNPSAADALEKELEQELSKIMGIIKNRMIIKGRRTLLEEDLKEE